MFFALCWQSRSHHEFSLTSAQQTSAPPAYQHGTQKASIQQQPLRTPVLDSMLLSGDQGQTSEPEDCLGRGWQGAGIDLASGFARRASHLRKRGRRPSAAFNRRVRCLRVCVTACLCVCVRRVRRPIYFYATGSFGTETYWVLFLGSSPADRQVATAR